VTARKTIDDLLAEARLGLDRVTPEEAFEAMGDGAVLVDVREPYEQAMERIPGAIERPLSRRKSMPSRNTGSTSSRYILRSAASVSPQS